MIFLKTSAQCTFKKLKSKTSARSMTMFYAYFNGYFPVLLRLKQGENCILTVNVTSEEGVLSILVIDPDKVFRLKQTTEISQAYYVKLEMPGEYRIELRAKDHRGGFDLSCGPEG